MNFKGLTNAQGKAIMKYKNNINKILSLKMVKSALQIMFFMLGASLIAPSALTAGVNPDGSFAHQIPIEIPPGTAGVQPNIGLVYNSNGGNGMVGVGWSLGGLPAIQRVNNGNGINFDGNDTYVGPGGKLVDVSGDRTLFHTEKESFADYIPNYTCFSGTLFSGVDYANEPCDWTIIDKAGNKLYFGTVGIYRNDIFSDSYNAAIGKQDKARVWALSKFEDIHGNYYEVEYAQDAGQIYPTRIIYTQNDQQSLSSVKIIDFIYNKNTRSDAFVQIQSGSAVTTNWLLSEIQVYDNGSCLLGCEPGDLVRKYIFTYDENSVTRKKRLTSVRRLGSNGGELSAQVFHWQHKARSFTIEEWGDGQQGAQPQVGDFNGDGLSDLLVYIGSGHGWDVLISKGDHFEQTKWTGSSGYNPTFVSDFNGDGFSDFLQSTGSGWRGNLSTGTGFGNSAIWSGNGYFSVQQFGDSNGDGRKDLIQNRDGVGWRTMLYIGNTFSSELWSGSGYWGGALVGDANGDGKTDLAINRPDYGWRFLLSTGSGYRLGSREYWSGDGIWAFPNLVDLNGDGLDDLLLYINNSNPYWRARISNGDGWADSGSWSTVPMGYAPKFGDFNGDGLIDILISSANYTRTILESSGSSFGASNWENLNQLPPIVLNRGQATDSVQGVGDFNGDGLSDIVYYDNGWKVLISDGPSPDRIVKIENGMGGSTQVAYEPATQFVNSDGTKAVTPQNDNYPILAAKSPRYLVRSITSQSDYDMDGDGANDTFSVSYEYTNGLFQSGYVADRKNLGFETVKTINDQTGAYSIVTYNQGLNANGKIIDTRLAGLPIRSTQYGPTLGTVNPLLQSSISRHEIIEVPYGTYLIRAKGDDGDLAGTDFASRTITYDPDTQVITQRVWNYITYEKPPNSEYHMYANVAKSAAKVGGLPKVTNEFTYEDNPTDHIYGRLIEKKQTDSAGNTLTHEKFEFDTNNNLVKKSAWLDKYWDPTGGKVTTDATNKFVSVTYQYDNPYGIPTTKTTPPSDNTATGSSVTYAFDTATYTKLLSSSSTVDGNTLTTSYEYHTKCGGVETVSGPNGSKITTLYDEFCRPTQTREGGAGESGKWLSKTQYNDIVTKPTQEPRIIKKTNTDPAGGTGYLYEKIYLDGMGRKIKISQGYHHYSNQNPDTTQPTETETSLTEFVTNSLGQIAAERTTFSLANNTVQETTYAYDSYGRATSVTYPEGVSTSYTYGVDTVTVTDPEGNTQTREWKKNTTGKRLSITEAGDLSATEYQFDQLGRLISATSLDGLETTVEYDSLNRKIFLNEPNTGTWAYAYYDSGQLKTQSDPKNQQITYSYDTLGRIKAVDYPGTRDDISYTYDDSTVGNALGRLTSVSDSSGVSSYSYDYRGNTTQWIKTIYDVKDPAYDFADPQGAAQTIKLTFQATYDHLNRLQTLTYPDGEQIANKYEHTGYLRQVRYKQLYDDPAGAGKILGEFGVPIVTYGADFANQTVTRTTGSQNMGNKVDTVIAYDPQTFRPTSLKTTAGTKIHHYSYQYDKVGNITAINDEHLTAGLAADPNYIDKSQAFQYDSKYRLTAATSHLYNGLTSAIEVDQPGVLNYAYTEGGNLTTKGDLSLYYGSDIRCNSPAGPQAVCGDSADNQYTYDINGNMTHRKGRDLSYDYEDRLQSITEAGAEKIRFVYNHTGSRVIKHNLVDNTVTYSIEGLYEITQHPDGREFHTKYIYGISGDLAAQITKDSADITIAGLNQKTEIMMASFYAPASLEGLAHKAYHYASARLKYTQTRGDLYLFLIFAITLLTISLLARGQTHLERPFLAGQSVAITIVFLFTFVFNGCTGTLPTSEDTPTWTSDLSGAPLLQDTLSGYNDTAKNARPTLGAFFFHPNHQGSTAMVTDSSGEFVSEVFYTPYGETIRRDAGNNPLSNGPDNFRYKYTAQEDDPETSLMYYGARYYDPGLGRFITQDTMIDPGAGTQGLNRYMYTAGNPVMNTDPSGHFIVAAIIIGAVIGAAIGGTGGDVFNKEAWQNFNVEGAVQGAFIGAAAGAFGAIAGAAAAAGYSGFAAATIGGAVSGGVGGFVSGATTAWANGASFGEGLAAGLASGVIGAISGGALGAMGYGLKEMFGNLNMQSIYEQWGALPRGPSIWTPTPPTIPTPTLSAGEIGALTGSFFGLLIGVSQGNNIPAGWPVYNGYVTSDYGLRTHPVSGEELLHAGYDFGTYRKMIPVRATASGTVEFSGQQSGYGETVTIAHTEMISTRTAHLTVRTVNVGDVVQKGQIIGYSGNTGTGTGIHVHHEVHFSSIPVDPTIFLYGF